MSITTQAELSGMQKVSEIVAIALREMRAYVQPGMSTQTLDQYGRQILEDFGAKSAPKLTYGFPGWSCISVNQEMAHGIPSKKKIMQEGDLINIDVSAALDGYWGDNGGSFVLGQDKHGHQPLVEASKKILHKAIQHIKGGVLLADIGGLIENEARAYGYKVIKNLTGHGIGKNLHEAPLEIPNFKDRFNKTRFKTNGVVAIETFISTHSTLANTQADGWTLIGNKGGYVAQHEHTILITNDEPIILTVANGIWN